MFPTCVAGCMADVLQMFSVAGVAEVVQMCCRSVERVLGVLPPGGIGFRDSSPTSRHGSVRLATR